MGHGEKVEVVLGVPKGGIPLMDIETVYRDHHRSIYRRCRQMLPSDQDAEDAAQDTSIST